MKYSLSYTINIVLFCFWAILICADQGLAADAVVLNVRGDVELIAQKQTMLIRTGHILQTNDRLRSRGGIASIMLSNGHIVKVEKDREIQITLGTKTSGNENIVSKVIGSLREMAQDTPPPIKKAMVRKGMVSIQTSRPCNTAIFPGNITFQWKIVGNVQTLQLNLKSLSPSLDYSQPLSPDSMFVVLAPEKAKLTTGVKYYWQIRAKDKDNTYKSQPCWFALLSGEEVTALQAELDRIMSIAEIGQKEQDFLKANIYVHYKVYDHAREILANYPDDEGMSVMLRTLQTIMQTVD